MAFFSTITFTGNGVQTDYQIGFDYVAQSHVKVFLDGVETSAFSFLTADTIRFDAAPADGARVVLRRNTSQSSRLVNFLKVTLQALTLNDDSKQGFFMAQEAIDIANSALTEDVTDGKLDAGSKVIKNLSPATVGTDAVNKDQLDAIQVASGNVPAPGAGDVGKFLKATATGVFGWVASTSTIVVDDISDAVTDMRTFLKSADLATARSNLGVTETPVGVIDTYIGTTAPSGWLLMNGASIGKSGSGATHADDGLQALFELCWNSMADTEAPVSTGRGASATADWDAGETLTMPDLRGRTVIGTGQGASLTDRVNGESDGEEAHTLTVAEMPGHSHPAANLGSTNAGAGVSAGIIGDGGGTTGAAGGDQAHNNMQPYVAFNYIVKT